VSDYKLTTSANGYGVWQCAITYEYPGLGNSPEALAVIDRSLRSAKRSIRRAIEERNEYKVRRLRYRVKANDVCHMNRLWSLTIEEA
jgi:hypothetical protein